MRAFRRRVVPILTLAAGCFLLTEWGIGAPLDKWILEEIERDEGILRLAAGGTEGRDIQLLEQSTTYVPFFLESPEAGVEQGEDIDWGLFERQKSTFLAGGYLYKLNFGDAPPLYGLSAGDWEGNTWYNPVLEKMFEIDPLKVWSGQGGIGFLYASILSGVPPRLVVYDQNGELKEEKVFDISNPDLTSEIEEVSRQYSQSGEPNLEMISLAEYLRNDQPGWRNVKVASSFNFRNQQERPEEIERLRAIEILSRKEARSELLSRLDGLPVKSDRVKGIQRQSKGGETEEIGSIKTDLEANSDGNHVKKNTSAWPLIGIALAVTGILVLLLQGRKGKSTR